MGINLGNYNLAICNVFDRIHPLLLPPIPLRYSPTSLDPQFHILFSLPELSSIIYVTQILLDVGPFTGV